MLLDGKTTTLLRKKLVRLFSPRKPLFRRRVRGSQGVAVAAHVRRRDGISYLDEETTSSLRIRLLECFLFVLLFRFQGTFSRGENEFIKKVHGATLAKRIY